MPHIPYDSSVDALIHPGKRPTVFVDGDRPGPLLLACEMARLAYIRFESDESEAQRLRESLARVGFAESVALDDSPSGAQAFVAWRDSDRLALVAFRGTEPDRLKDILADAAAMFTPWDGDGRVHAGFADRTRALLPRIENWLDDHASPRAGLLLTGHSLGAAMATLAATRLPGARLITLGSPRVGDSAFAQSLRDVPCTRIVDHLDLVTSLPPGGITRYMHVSKALRIARDGSVGAAASDADHDADQDAGHDAGHPGVLDTLSTLLGHGHVPLPRRLSDHSPINYVRAFA